VYSGGVRLDELEVGRLLAVISVASIAVGASPALGAPNARARRAGHGHGCRGLARHRRCGGHQRVTVRTRRRPRSPSRSAPRLVPDPGARRNPEAGNAQGGAGCAIPDLGEDQLWTRAGPGWTGGDGTYSVSLPDGRSVWIFGDTFLGTIKPDGSRARSTPFVHNSLVVQNGSRLSDLYEGSRPRFGAVVSAGNTGGFYWPGAGFVQEDKLRLFLLGFRSIGSGAWDFAYTGSVLATFALPSLSLVSVAPVTPSANVEWGSWVFDVGDFTYIYGVEDQGLSKYVHVARVRSRAPSGRWQYYGAAGWSYDPRASTRVLGGVSNQFSVVRMGPRYELISQDDTFSRTISAYAGATPAGPFGSKTSLYTTPDWGSGTYTYNAVAHPEQTGSGGLLVSYNVNSLDPLGDYTDAALYRPHFVRVARSCFPS
jgi:hypothetical protein